MTRQHDRFPRRQWIPVLGLLCVVMGLFSAHAETEPTPAAAEAPPLVWVLEVKGPIGPATTGYLRRGLQRAAAQGVDLVVLEMDTPGGLLTSTREIVADILAAPVPVATHVAPAGARAASAGTYILYASHISAMAPGTTIGAATPVSMGAPGGPAPEPPRREDRAPADDEPSGEPTANPTAEPGNPSHRADPPRAPSEGGDAMTAKAINDAEAYLRSLAELRGRDIDFAVAAVREAKTLTATEAHAQNVADHLVADTDALILAVDGASVQTGFGTKTLTLTGATIEAVPPDWRTRFLRTITDPNIIFILMTLGIYGIIFELSSPGNIFPGLVGALCLLTGIYAMNVIPVDSYGIALMVLGIALLAAEAFVPSFGILGIGGLVSLILGGVVLLDSDVPGLQLSPWTVVMTGAAGALILIAFVLVGITARRAQGSPTLQQMVGREARVNQWTGSFGRLTIDGRAWPAKGPSDLQPGAMVTVVAVDNERLAVEPATMSQDSLSKT